MDALTSTTRRKGGHCTKEPDTNRVEPHNVRAIETTSGITITRHKVAYLKQNESLLIKYFYGLLFVSIRNINRT